jgi:hypothetical protein
MMRKLSLLALFSLTASCTAEPGGSIQLVHVMGPDQQCLYTPEGKDVRYDGFYDPTVSGTDNMEVTVRINNSMNDKDSDPRSNDNNTNLKFSGNDVTMSGFNVCYRLESELTDFGAADSGYAFKCDDVINATSGQYKEYVSGGGIVEADPKGQSEGAPVKIRLFSKSTLQGLFGADIDFDKLLEVPEPTENPENCAQWGVKIDGTASALCVDDAVSPKTSYVTAIGDAWGDWPEDSLPEALDENPHVSQRVLVVMQGVGVTTAGSTVKTNWFNFSVDLCPGCTQITHKTACPYAFERKVCNNDFGTCTTVDSNGDQVTESCVSPAGKPDGQTGCSDGTTPCQGGMLLGRVEYTPSNPDSCDESQELGINVEPVCLEVDTCTTSE